MCILNICCTFAGEKDVAMKKGLLIVCLLCALMVSAQEVPIPRDYVPEDHLTWLGFRGPVKEVKEYNYGDYGKREYRFDPFGRLVEYVDYANPFFGDGGCVFGLWERFRYAYDSDGKIIFLETYNAENTLVDAYDDMVLELFPKQCKDADLFPKAELEYGDTTRCFSKWTDDKESQHYYGRRFDKYGNWIEEVSADEDDYYCANVRVRDIRYYKDIEVMGLQVGVKTVTHTWKADGKKWGNRYEFDREGMLVKFRSWCEKEELYVWEGSEEGLLGSDLIVPETSEMNTKISYWKK